MRPGPRRTALGAFLALLLGSVALAGATTLPLGFSQEVVAAGLDAPTGIAFFPDGRIAIAQKGGVVRLVKAGALLPTPLIDISARVNDYWDRGLLGIAVDPDFASHPYVYLLYVYENDPSDFGGSKTSRVTRVTVSGDTASLASEVVILGKSVGRSCDDYPVGTDCIPAHAPSHSVGGLRFATDETLFVTLGDASGFSTVDPDSLRAQDLDWLSGKVLRVTRAGQGLSTNPYWNGHASANRSKIWAYGVRNAFRFTLKPGSGTPYIGDVGWDNYEEIDVATPGANLGWPCYEGAHHQLGFASFPQCQALYSTALSGTLAASGIPIARVPSPKLGLINDGDRPPVGNGEWARQYDSWDGQTAASEDWVGYTFPTLHTFNRVVFQEGMHFWDGGWFLTLTVQVRQNGQWIGVSNLTVNPAYPAGDNGVYYESYTLDFTPIQGDGIRIYGAPGGVATFVSLGELDVFEVTGSGGSPASWVDVTGQATAPIARVPSPKLGLINDGDRPPVGNGEWARQYDSWDGQTAASEDWVGYTFPTLQTFNRVVFQEGMHFWDGGWFLTLTVQVRQNGQWIGVSNLTVNPAYPASDNGVYYESYTLDFTPIQGDGIRIYGAPGGVAAFVSLGELTVYAPGTGSPPGSATGGATPPLLEYPHGGGAAVIGGPFYTASIYPQAYQGAYFFGDYTHGTLRTLRVDAQDALVPGSVSDFATETDGPVDIALGPDGLIYYVAISANEVRRIRFTTGNTPPGAVASGNPIGGLAPVTVAFSSAGSNDPDGDPLTFDWDFGDGSVGTGPAPQHTYQLPNGTRVATLTVRDNHGGVAAATVTIQVGNRPPVAKINSPGASFKYKVGTVVSYSGSASDPDQGSLPASALSWQIVIHHCPGGFCHAHPLLSSNGASGSFTVPDHGDDSYFELILTATDAGGLTSTVSRAIQPQTVQLTIATVPPGLQVSYGGTGGSTPLVRTTIVGSVHTINTISPQGTSYFLSWSDAEGQQHDVTIGTANVTYTARFSPCPIGQFRAEYFDNRTLSGAPVFIRCETAINNSWGNGGPGNGIGNDNFSVRWTGRFTFPAGSRTFTTVSSDGVRLWVDDVRLINRWTDHSPITDNATQTMTAGDHEVKVEYYEHTGSVAVIQVSW